jgi:glutathione S-transferase
MWQLHCFPLCPFSRKVRLALSEKGLPFSLVRENPWEGADAFLTLNPAGRTPVLRDPNKHLALADSQAIC